MRVVHLADGFAITSTENIANGDVVIPSIITSIGGGAFADLTNLVSITIPESVTNIDDYAFGNCTSLASIAIPNSVTNISDGTATFAQAQLEGWSIPEGATAESFSAFAGCSNIVLTTQENSAAHQYALAHPAQFDVENIVFITAITSASEGTTMAGVVAPLQLRAAVPTKIAFSIDPNKAANYTSIPGGSFETSTFDFVNACNSPLSFTVTSIAAREEMPAVVANDKFTEAGWQNLSAADTLLNIAFGFVADTPAQWAVRSNMDAWYPLSSLLIGTLNGGVTGEMHLKSKYGMAWTDDAPETIIYDVVYKVDAA